MDVGFVLDGRYRIVREIGRGGMGRVVEALHLALDQSVAIKHLIPGAYDAPLVGRFLREARSAFALRSAHVCRVFDLGQLENGAPFMVMEMLQGWNLSDLLRRHGKMEEPAVLEIALQACEGLAEAHAHGIVHRDLKPANLFLCTDQDGGPLVKLLDFGIAKEGQSSNDGLTTTGAVIGTPHYMSPEQLRGARNVDTRADVWALGATLCELLIGKRLFASESFAEVCAQIVGDVTPIGLAPVPKRWRPVLERCLERDIDRRFQDVAELAASIANLGEDWHQVAAERVARVLVAQAHADKMLKRADVPTVTVEAALGAAALPTPAVASAEVPPGRGRWARNALSAAGLLFGGVLLGALVNRPAAEQAPAVAAPIASARADDKAPAPAVARPAPAAILPVAVETPEPVALETSRELGASPAPSPPATRPGRTNADRPIEKAPVEQPNWKRKRKRPMPSTTSRPALDPSLYDERR